MAFVSRESNGSGNDVNLGGIVAKKQIAGTSGNWTQGSLTFYTRSGGTRNDALFLDQNGFVTIQGNETNNAYNSVTGRRLMFGGGDGDAQSNYYIGTNLENYGGNYNKLDLRWHTGIRMGAQAGYGGIRFYDSEDLGTQVFAIGKDGSYAQANQSMRAPIYYDLDNTGYYIDPTSVSNIIDLIIANNIASPANYYNGLQLEVQATSGTAGIGLHRSGFSHCGIYHDTSDVLKFNFNNGTVTLNAGAGTLVGSGNDTTYIRLKDTVTSEDWNTFINESEASYRLVSNGSGSNRPGAYMYGVVLSMAYSGGGKFQLYAPHNGTDGNGLWVRTGWDTDYDAWNEIAIQSRSFANNVDLRAPIFYDNNDTGYYVNPNAASRFNGILEIDGGHYDTEIRLTALASKMGSGVQSAMSWWISEPNVTWNDGGFGYNVTNDGGSPSGFGRLNASLGQAYMRFLGGGNMVFYCTNTSGTRETVMQLFPANYAEFYGSVRSPIYYDYNNTGYYLDAASGSRLATINADYIYSGYDSGVTNSVSCSNWFRSNGSSGWFNASYGGGIFMEDGTYVKVYASKAFYVANNIDATGNITAYYSDERLKTRTGLITNAIDKVKTLDGFYYVENETAKELGYNNEEQQVGLSAQQVQAILPEAIHMAPVDIAVDEDNNKYSKTGENYLTVDYSRLVPLLIEAIKELTAKVEALEAK